jgi:feruloyl esterase
MAQRLRVWIAVLCAFPGSASFAEPASDHAPSCEKLASLSLTRTTLDAHDFPAGPFSPETRGPRFEVPAFCRVSGVVRPVAGSRIGFETWLPRSAWNNRLIMLGNGGYSSTLPWHAMSALLDAGYAVVATDTGHTGDGPEFAIGNPQSIVDWGNRAIHLTAIRAKQLVAGFYEQPARHAYFHGCSTGGQQALMEAQRFPKDFDGIIAGAPGHNRTHLNAGFLWQFVQNHARGSPPRQIIPASKLPKIANAAFAACRMQNGASAGGLASDTWLNDPLSCDFDPGVLACPAAESADCLTQEQVEALRRMYAGAHNPRTGSRIYFGWPPGSEAGWHFYWADPSDPTAPARAGFWRHWAPGGEEWNWQAFDFDRDMARADDELAHLINATNPDLEKFRRRGGKLIQYHGTADPVVPYADSISYHERVVQEQKHTRRLPSLDDAERETSQFYRLFLAPGLGHCQGGPGPAPVDAQQALEDWVERGKPPDRLPAARSSGGVNNEAFSRPLCPYPGIARYEGTGPPNAAESFTCSMPESVPTVTHPAREYLK